MKNMFTCIDKYCCLATRPRKVLWMLLTLLFSIQAAAQDAVTPEECQTNSLGVYVLLAPLITGLACVLHIILQRHGKELLVKSVAVIWGVLILFLIPVRQMPCILDGDNLVSVPIVAMSLALLWWLALAGARQFQLTKRGWFAK